MSDTRTWPGGSTNVTPTTYSIPTAGEKNWASLTDFLDALGTGAQATTFQKYAIRTALTSPVTINAATDCVVVVNLSVPGATAVTLPAGQNKIIFWIVDGKGDAATHNITITPNGAETINGAASLVINGNREAVMLAFDSSTSNWSVASRSSGSGTTGTVTSVDVSGGTTGLTTSGGPVTTSGVITLAGTLAVANGGTGVTTSTGTGNVVLSNTPTLVTPVLGAATGTSLQLSGLTISRALATDASKNLVSSATTDVELGYVSGVTSSIQTQLNTKTTNPLTTTGDLVYASNTATPATAARLGIGATSTVLNVSGGLPSWSLLVDANISAGAAISYSKLATLTSGNIIVGSAGNVAASVAMSGDVGIVASGSTTIQAGAIDNSKVNATAAIAVSKLAALTANRALASDGSGFLSVSATTATELGYVNGVTSAIQTQLNAKATNPLTTTGDIIYASNTATPATAARLGIGATSTVLNVSGGIPSWSLIADANISSSASISYSKLANMTAANILIGNVSNVPTVTAVTGDIGITSAGVTAIQSGAVTNAKVSATAAIDYSKLATMTSANILLGNNSNVATVTAVTGNVTISNTGVTTIGSGVIVDSMISSSASISYSKLANMTAANILVGNVSNVPTVVAVSGVIAMSNAGVTSFASGAFGSNNISTTGTLSSGNATLSGFTDGSAASSGKVGEIISASLARGSATGLTSNTAKTIATLTLTAGDWDIWGFGAFSPAGGTAFTANVTAISATTNALPAVTTRAVQNASGEITLYDVYPSRTPGDDFTQQTLMSYLSVGSGTTLYLVMQATFTSTCNAYGSIIARRRR